jgi:hypothetical protein
VPPAAREADANVQLELGKRVAYRRLRAELHITEDSTLID